MESIPVILIFDVGKTNKKTLLFDERYNVVLEESVRFEEILDEDGFPCEDIDGISNWITSTLARMLLKTEFDIKAINFSAYGASFVYVDKLGKVLLPLYNYLKPYPEKLQNQFYNKYGGKEEFARQTASPILGSLNSGLQLYRIKQEKPEVFANINYALHLPQYLNYIITNRPVSEITSIGCHTSLWDFTANKYHEWVYKEGIHAKLPPIHMSNICTTVEMGGKKMVVGIGLHDSSAALIPYLAGFHEPFVLLSTGTWCISLNAFNRNPLSIEELEKDCLCYLTYDGTPVKASRLFAGHEHEQQAKRLAEYYGLTLEYFNSLDYNLKNYRKIQQDAAREIHVHGPALFNQKDLSQFSDSEEAYHQLVIDIVARQRLSTRLVQQGTNVKRLFVDGGFSKNSIYMHLMATMFPELEVFAASVAQASSVGAALAIHKHWNNKSLPSDIISLKYYSDVFNTIED